MRCIHRKAMVKLLVANGVALALLALGLLSLASQAASEPPASQLQRPGPLAVSTPALEADSPPSEVSTPTSVLDLFFSAAESRDQLGGTDAEGLVPLAAEPEVTAADLFPLGITPVFTWADGGGTFSMDWGDVDRDGDLDLAVGGSYGTAVYLNNGKGRFKLGPVNNTRYALDVRWANLDTDPYLELVAVGGSSDNTPMGETVDYVYTDPEALPISRRLSPLSRSDDIAYYEVKYYNDYYGPAGPPSVPAALTGWEYRINHDWGYGSPVPGFIDADNFFVRWRGTKLLEADLYTFYATADDGVRVWVDGENIIDAWKLQSPTTYSATKALSEGLHEIVMEYFERGGTAVAKLRWKPRGVKQLLRVAPGDYDNDDLIDVVASTNALNPVTCPVLLYRGSGPPYDGLPTCVSNEATASLAPADFDNDGDLDLALGLYESKTIRVIRNTGTLSVANPSVPVDPALAHIPYDLAWGDYDRDGYLDLAAAFPLEQEVRVYRNIEGESFTSAQTIPTTSFLTPLAVDWADLNGDGGLELIVADLPPQIYRYVSASQQFTAMPQLQLPVFTGRIQDIRAVDLDKDTDLDLALANQFGPSTGFAINGQLLSPTLTVVHDGLAQSVAWGDFNSDGWLDLAVATASRVRLYRNNQDDTFTSVWSKSGVDARSVAWADYDRDGWLDLAVATDSGVQIYGNTNGTLGQSPITVGSGNTQSVAWGDFNSDGRLDLALAKGTNGVELYNNKAYNFTAVGDALGNGAQSVAWADFNKDYYLDFALAKGASGVQLYRNNKNGTFTSVWSNAGDARSVAWGDYDADGWPDLAVGNYGQKNYVYRNQAGKLRTTGVSLSPGSKTTSLAWGDWDNDGDLDLAIGNDGQKDQVYANVGTPTAPKLVLIWQSREISTTTAVAWGDKDRDGDLDLAVSTGTAAGVYENNSLLPAHVDNFASNEPRPHVRLPQNPAYLAVERPGKTDDAYFFSSAEILGQANSAVPLTYTLYDPEGDPVVRAFYSYSLDGGGIWTETTVTPLPDGTTTPTGRQVALSWHPPAELGAVSDNALFRVSIVHEEGAGPVQRASSSAVSPPFRLRATTCVWPSGPSIQPDDSDWPHVTLLGLLEEGDGVLTFTWELGKGTIKKGQFINYNFSGTTPVTLTVTGEPCPVNRPVLTGTIVSRPSSLGEPNALTASPGPYRLYLPLVLRSRATDLVQVTGLQGEAHTRQGSTYLEWSAGPADDLILGYRIYRAPRGTAVADFQILDTVPAETHSYVDQTAGCGFMYFVAAFNAAGESPASTTSYFSPACR